MRYFYDCEFLENGVTIDLISIGIVAEDGRELYLVNSNAPWSRIANHEWLMSNVVHFLPVEVRNHDIHVDYDHPAVQPYSEIRKQVHEFLLADGDGLDRDARELWAWYGAYDHVALCQMWGRMIDLPDGVPMFTRDIKQEHVRLGSPVMPQQAAGEHHALDDARHNRVMFEHLQQLAPVVAVVSP